MKRKFCNRSNRAGAANKALSASGTNHSRPRLVELSAGGGAVEVLPNSEADQTQIGFAY